jgi:hypothetical protein
MRIITTPNGIGNKAHDIWSTNYRTEGNEGEKIPSLSSVQNSGLSLSRLTGEGGRRPGEGNSEGDPSLACGRGLGEGPIWKCHFVDIHRAAADGLPVNIEELKAGMADPEGWAQEFECQFLDAHWKSMVRNLI